jgi:diguanylate cyclase (GGDEF)-like protein
MEEKNEGTLGVLEVLGGKSGFIRRKQASYTPSDDDIYVGQRLIHKHKLRTGDEIDRLIGAYNEMSRRLRESEVHREQVAHDLQRAKESLEHRVAERTRDLQALNEQMAREIAERAELQAELAKAARTDPLTGLLNRRAMFEHLEHELARCRRSGSPFVVLLGDVDHFKQINDTYGHDVGDRVLARLAEKLKRSLRNEDLVARWGGEEFLALLPDTRIAGGMTTAEKVRRNVESERFDENGKAISLSFSFGVAEIDPEGSLTACIQRADRALYQAKQAGRNRVVAADDHLAVGSGAAIEE